MGGGVPLPVALAAVHAAEDLCAQVARALRPILPKGVRCKLEVNAVDDAPLEAHHVAVQFRPAQPRKKAM